MNIPEFRRTFSSIPAWTIIAYKIQMPLLYSLKQNIRPDKIQFVMVFNIIYEKYLQKTLDISVNKRKPYRKAQYLLLPLTDIQSRSCCSSFQSYLFLSAAISRSLSLSHTFARANDFCCCYFQEISSCCFLLFSPLSESRQNLSICLFPLSRRQIEMILPDPIPIVKVHNTLISNNITI